MCGATGGESPRRRQQISAKVQTQAGYAAWERDSVTLRPEQIRQLAKILNVPVESLLGETEDRRLKTGPTGKVRRVFEKVGRLPRHQQSKVVEFVDAFVERHLTGQPR